MLNSRNSKIFQHIIGEDVWSALIKYVNLWVTYQGDGTTPEVLLKVKLLGSNRLYILILESILKAFHSAVVVQEAHEPELMIVDGDDLDVFLGGVGSAWRRIDCFKLMQWDNYLFESKID